MMNNQPTIVRILLDNQRNQLDTLVSAAALAGKLQSSLQGVFIEDDSLLRAAELPFSKEISLWSARESPMTSNSLQRTLRAYAKHVKKELEKVAGHAQIPCSFQTIRGERTHWILESGNKADILFINTLNPSPPRRYSIHTHQQPVQLVYADTDASKRALNTAIQVANQTRRPLTILTLSENEQQQNELQDHINTALRQAHITSKVSITHSSLKTMESMIQQAASYMLILPTDMQLAQDLKTLRPLLQKIRSPIIFVK